MKKPLKIVLIVLVVILVLPVITLISWTFQTKKPMNILILDKTVPTVDRVHHRSLVWTLTNGRYVKKDNKTSYSYTKDYYGFSPLRPLRDKLWKVNRLELTEVFNMVEKYDALYFADTYGVYANDWWQGINESRRSRKMYGGLNNTDLAYFVEMQKRNKLCILEYNTFDYPTAPLEIFKMKKLYLFIENAGWTGKYFSSLDTAAKSNTVFPIWMTSMYRKEYHKPWSFTKPGVVLLKGSDIVVLEEGTHLKSALPIIKTDSVYLAKYGVANNVAFQGWFEIIDPLRTNVISTFNLETTAVGDTLLFENFLSNQFPAVITDTLNQRTYYFTGDFATNNVPYWISRFKGVEKLKGLLYTEKPDDSRNFFWLYYKPLLNSIFGDYYKTLNAK
jgi:hypothetical protein